MFWPGVSPVGLAETRESWGAGSSKASRRRSTSNAGDQLLRDWLPLERVGGHRHLLNLPLDAGRNLLGEPLADFLWSFPADFCFCSVRRFGRRLANAPASGRHRASAEPSTSQVRLLLIPFGNCLQIRLRFTKGTCSRSERRLFFFLQNICGFFFKENQFPAVFGFNFLYFQTEDQAGIRPEKTPPVRPAAAQSALEAPGQCFIF